MKQFQLWIADNQLRFYHWKDFHTEKAAIACAKSIFKTEKWLGYQYENPPLINIQCGKTSSFWSKNSFYL